MRTGQRIRQFAGVLARLRHDAAGNTLAMMAAMLVPLIGFSGSAVDMARVYVVKSRLQQACDAGALAGRKAMTDTSPNTPLDSTAAAQANAFFTNNFKSGFFKTSNVSFTPTKSASGNSTAANTVSGTATAQVPMTLMQFFGFNPINLTVTCQAVMDIADTDVMFVLDTTGSMSCTPESPDSCANAVASYTREDGTTGWADQESSGSKIDGLRQAVVLFDQTIHASADPSTRIRYGFVPYSSAVNVGYSIPSQYLQSTWTYQSRRVIGDYNVGAPAKSNVSGYNGSTCTGSTRSPTTGYTASGSIYQATVTTLSWASGTCTKSVQTVRAQWRYQPWSTDVSALLSGATITDPSRIDGSTVKWRGCVEAVDTKVLTSIDPSNPPDDLNPDFIPTSSSDMWRPMVPQIEWLRGTSSPNSATEDVQDGSLHESSPQNYFDVTYRDGSWFGQGGSAACGKAALRLQTMTSQQVHDYVYGADFKPFGGTYHDVGMTWGVRMLSPSGIFASDNTPSPGRNTPSRNIVFMTDGAMAPQTSIYGQYGMELFDQRVDGTASGNDYANHTARFRAECDIAKARGITIYVVALGTSITPDLTYCASPGQTFQASHTADLTAAFKQIAARIAKLRITA